MIMILIGNAKCLAVMMMMMMMLMPASLPLSSCVYGVNVRAVRVSLWVFVVFVGILFPIFRTYRTYFPISLTLTLTVNRGGLTRQKKETKK